MNKVRLEAFSDGVIAIIITIMVLELKTPHGPAPHDLAPVLPVMLRYLLSFIYVGIYWINHHYLFDKVHKVDGVAMWANLHLLFWISLIPFVTAWAGEHPFDSVPVAMYGVVLLMCSIGFVVLDEVLRRRGAMHSGPARPSWMERKNLASMLLYALAIPLALWYAPAGSAVHVIVALLWLRPRAPA
ncbi:TMEM175 family protein [Massilia aquatica]|uniref:DUF1211 domain-containing protein n=1 Tax=Massilia aquatica TaxID=2609000 RepID=A0ABX0MDT5_9BURK|nr:TMEM175 family protein [Massilia aquatica]NHZ43098.1 DUF1211 domain-containing protein [Massilia aquatica]